MKYLRSKIEYFITDFDGTICNLFSEKTKSIIISGIADFFKKSGYIPMHLNCNDPFKVWIESYYEAAQTLDNIGQQELFEVSSSVFSSLELEISESATLYEGVLNAYDEIIKDFKQNAIVSSNHVDTIKNVLNKYNLLDKVGLIIGREHINSFDQLKPNAFLLEKALKELGAKSTNSLYIGDNEVDMKASNSLNCKAIGVLRGRDDSRKSSLYQSGADLVLDEFRYVLNAKLAI